MNFFNSCKVLYILSIFPLSMRKKNPRQVHDILVKVQSRLRELRATETAFAFLPLCQQSSTKTVNEMKSRWIKQHKTPFYVRRWWKGA